MRIKLLILSLAISGCTTIDQAKIDFHNFKKTIDLNTRSKYVYSSSQY